MPRASLSSLPNVCCSVEPTRLDLYGRVEIGRVVARDAHDAGAQVAGDARAQLDRGAVRGDSDRRAVADATGLRVVASDLDLLERTLESELGRAVDRRAREERAVGDESQPGNPWLPGARTRLSPFGLPLRAWRKRGALVHVRE